MSNSNTPRGFKPVRYVDNRPFSGGFNTYRLPSGYATTIFTGDVVQLLTTGYVAKAAAGTQMRGVAIGFEWTDTSGTPKVSPFFPANTATQAGSDVRVHVVDDPNVLFEAVFTNSTTAPVTSDIGAAFNLIDNGGSIGSGLSGEGVDYTTSTAGTAQFQLLDFVQRVDNDTTSAYSRGLFLPKSHDFRVTTAV